MAPRGTKRAATVAPRDVPEAKRANDFLKQQGITKTSLGAVLEILDHPLAGLPEDCRQLVKAGLPWSISVPQGERHGSQESVVNMVSEVIDQICSNMQCEITEASQGVSKVVEDESTVQERLKVAEKDAEDAENARKDRSKELSDASEKTVAARTAVKEAKAEKTRREKALASITKEKDMYEDTFNNVFRKMKSLEWEEKETKALLAKLSKISGKLQLESSLETALPNVMVKRERGPFDTMVMDSFEDVITKKIQGLAADEASTNAGVTEQAAALEAAETQLTEVNAAQQAAAEALSLAQDHQLKTSEAFQAVKLEASSGEALLAKAKETLKEKEDALQTFKDYNMEIFASLRDRKVETPEESAQKAGA